MLLVASYYFYMNWKPAYALLIFISTITTWGGAILLNRNSKRSRKFFLIVTLAVNLGILFTFKYLVFVSDELRHLLTLSGIGIDIPEFTLLLPVGISFYTFQAIGYLIDVWRGKLLPERNLFTYALFVSFFPQLVAGPIERATNLLRQFHTRHAFSSEIIIRGLELMTFGYFMKLCIAENVAPYVNAVFNNLSYHNGYSILLASFFFTFQIFCDFAGYSLIAIGVAHCMGFTLMQNFRQPYLATSVKDFWRRWHISLSSWFSDYVYIPLGGNRVRPFRHFVNLFVTFLVSGIWHGAAYTFVVWGAYHGLLQCIHTACRKWTSISFPDNALFRSVNIACTFILMLAGWIFFRANSLSDAFLAFRKIADERGILYNGNGKPAIVLPILLIGLLMIVELVHEYRDRHPLRSGSSESPLWKSAALTTFFIILILTTAKFESGQFIYFQF